MYTTSDERNGLVKVYWEDIRERVAEVEPTFVRLVDELSPDRRFPLYLVYYPYGAITTDTISPLLPDMTGGFYRLSEADTPKDVWKHLGYGSSSAPLGMVLEKSIEFFTDQPEAGITIPFSINKPGHFMTFARALSKGSRRIYAPNGILTSTSGARSVFMLPNIGCRVHQSHLQRDINIQAPPPKSLYEHWDIFKAIINSGSVDCDWRSCLLYFSEAWVDHILKNDAWAKLNTYLHQLAWQYSEYDRNRIYYDLLYSLIQRTRNLKPNPYLADTACHLFTVALGAIPGYVPADNDNALPLKILQTVFVESYRLKKYIPTIIQPDKFIFEDADDPIYYSMQYPSTYSFSPKSRKMSSTLLEIRELEHITHIFSEELGKEQSLCADTILGIVARNATLNFFHNRPDPHQVISPSQHIEQLDKRFCSATIPLPHEPKFSSDGKFVRGCVSISPAPIKTEKSKKNKASNNP